MRHQALIKKLKAGLKSDETGNKANSLIFLHRYGFNIPQTFLVPTYTHEKYLREGFAIINELREELALLPKKNYAVRSSTTAEDSKEYSFAGQFQTLININGTENILAAIHTVWESASLLNDNEYLRRARTKPFKCAVIIQEMIPSKFAGVSFSRNPVTDQNEIVIEAVEGFGEELVQKGITPLRWRLRKKMVFEGNEHHPYFNVIRQVSADTARLKRYYGSHIDIEWAYDGKQLYYLQLRQITGRKEIHIYSNKMAKEMLPGQIKPLVWSVNIPLVNSTWIKLLSEITGPLAVKPEDLARPFYYHVYFNVAALGKIFSEFGMSADSLEQLMTRGEDARPSFRPGLKTLKHTFRIIRFLYEKIHFEKIIVRQYEDLKSKFRHIDHLLQKEFVLSFYPDLYSILFNEGKRLAYLNIVTPMLMMMYHKKLKKNLGKKNLDYNTLDFRIDFPELLTYSPLPSLQKIKKEIYNLPEDIRKRCDSLASLRSMDETEDIVRDIDKFITEFGHLSESGNDFSYPKWEEDPDLVFRMIMDCSDSGNVTEMYSLSGLQQKGLEVNNSLRKAYLKAGKFKLFREQISSLYIYGYGLFRKLFLGVGKELAEKGIIDTADDVFYLRKEEIDPILDATDRSSFEHYRDLIRRRREEMEATKDIILPPVIYGEEPPLPETGKFKNHSGTGTSPGSYTGITKVVRRTADFDSVLTGDVLLIPFSDVSWTPVLVRAGAIVSETGGMLSHCSIIAREMGIPALVSVDNACALGNGLKVTVDGSNGLLTIHDYE